MRKPLRRRHIGALPSQQPPDKCRISSPWSRRSWQSNAAAGSVTQTRAGIVASR
jgi:hypothetical protein